MLELCKAYAEKQNKKNPIHGTFMMEKKISFPAKDYRPFDILLFLF